MNTITLTNETLKKICLIALPWSQKDHPSGALGALGAYLRRERPQDEVVCRHEFVNVAAAIGFPLYDKIAECCYSVGELLYLAQFYPGKREEVRRHFEEWAGNNIGELGRNVADGPARENTDWGAVFDRMDDILREHLADLAADLSLNFDIVGLTTSTGQLFANLTLARRIKEISPRTRIVLGGPTISSRVGPSIMQEYPFVDYMIQGEGERPLTALLEVLDQPGTERAVRGILSRANFRDLPAGAQLWEVERMDELPYPDFAEYEALAEQFGIGWTLPLEGSRGCWWDRIRKTGDPTKACYFCNLNVQWNGYRQKSVPRLVSEMATLSDKHRNLRLFFLDNIIRAPGSIELAEAIQRLGKDFEIFYEMRANIKPYELLAMKEAGLTSVQFGIEGLSTPFLKRIGKGTTTIQNLQVMKLSRELGISNAANLIFDFPGATPEEVEETRVNMLDYAIAYEPLSLSSFALGVDSTVDVLREKFGIRNVRNQDVFKLGMPEEVWKRLRLFGLDYDRPASPADWSPVKEAASQWAAFHSGRVEPALRYRDGGSFVTILDERGGENREGTYVGLARDVYMYCMEMRTLDQITRRFGPSDTNLLQEALHGFLEDKLMFHEGDRYLSLAMAPNPEIAARRIRATYDAEGKCKQPVPDSAPPAPLAAVAG